LPATGASVLPPLYARWIDDLLGVPIEPETHATCSNCAMAAPKGTPPDPEAAFFNPRVKCCTFVPVLPNFLVGRILRDRARANARGRASIEARIAAGAGVTPLGLGRVPAQETPDAVFGQDESFLCPHFVREGGTCSIWRHREAVCATFFCKIVRGAMGAQFWRALRQLLEATEQMLAWQCAEALGVAVTVDGTAPPAATWGSWAGRERAFYEAAAGLVERLSWHEVLERAGPDVRLHAEHVRETHARLRGPAVPAGSLRRSPFIATNLNADSVRLTTYSGMDPLTIPRTLFDTLAQFDGRTATAAIAAIEAEHGVRIDPAVVGRLVDFQVLVPAPDATTLPGAAGA
jgi:Fe-S-cluster containining protein